MDMEDEDVDGNLSGLQERMPENNLAPPLGEDTPDGMHQSLALYLT